MEPTEQVQDPQDFQHETGQDSGDLSLGNNGKYTPDDQDLSVEEQEALLDIVRCCEKEDDYIRKQQLRDWKKNERFWHGVQHLYWDSIQGDWVSPVDTRTSYGEYDANRDGVDQIFYDYVVNIYQAYGESIISALAAQMPAVRFPPDDADNPDDIITARTYDKIGDLITRHNHGKIAILQILLTLWNQGLVAFYHYPKADRKYGTFQVPQYDINYRCPNCADYTQPTAGQCPQCGTNLIFEQVISGYTDCPKSRVIWEIFGPLFVKVGYWCRKQEDFGYILLQEDKEIPYLQEMYSAISEKISHVGSTGPYDDWERIGRSPSQYDFSVNDNTNLATHRRCWLRTWQFNILGKDKQDIIDSLKRRFPDGCFVAFVNDIYAESRNECMDECWSVGKGKLSTYIHADSLGKALIPIQEAKNTVFNLEIETMEQSIETTYADPDSLDFEDYGRHEAKPGMVYPAKPKAGQKLADSFYASKPAQLSQEVEIVKNGLNQDGQFVTGAVPSLWGGEDSSNTLGEYESSKQQALQRISITWTLLNKLWAVVISKSVKHYVKALADDEKYVVRRNGGYANVWIRMAELTGKVGDVEAEGADTFPVSILQKQSLLFKLFGMNNPLINEVLQEPDNRSQLAEALGFPELKIPQEAQRIRQLSEINKMIESGVTLPINPDIDDDDVHIDVLKNMLISEEGDLMQMENPAAYQANIQHLQMHTQNQAAAQAAQQEQMLKTQIQLQQVKQSVNAMPQVGAGKDVPGATKNESEQVQ